MLCGLDLPADGPQEAAAATRSRRNEADEVDYPRPHRPPVLQAFVPLRARRVRPRAAPAQMRRRVNSFPRRSAVV